MKYVVNPFQSPAILSFCPGILGLERGLARVGVDCRVMAYVEIEAFIIANLVAGMEAGLVDPAPVWTDAKTFDARPFHGRIHGIIGGYPCPGESLAGLREGHLYKGFIWPSIRRAIAAARPIWCFFENVDDHLTGTYPIVQRSLCNMGYSVEAGIFSAEEVGAPHERQRLFILAINEELANTLCSGAKSRAGDIIGKSRKIKESTQRENGEWLRHDFRHGSETMAYSSSQRLQGLQQGLVYGQGSSVSRSVAQCCQENFPLGQGFKQRSWEKQRQIESRLEYTINGYQFEGDLLRSIGNSVVEQTAEIAFENLLQKHIDNSFR